MLSHDCAAVSVYLYSVQEVFGPRYWLLSLSLPISKVPLAAKRVNVIHLEARVKWFLAEEKYINNHTDINTTVSRIALIVSGAEVVEELCEDSLRMGVAIECAS